ncbi:MAG: anthranilate synthase component I [Acidobacteria bacterium]|nr:anthranilate synthase component I [Acidobacteriota bacterium]
MAEGFFTALRNPDVAELDELRREWEVIPFVRLLCADTITPVAAFRSLADGGEAFLLESVERGEQLGRYSFLGVRPRRSLSIDCDDEGAVDRLREELRPLRVWRSDVLPPFFGGAVGYIGYGAAQWTEKLPDRHRSDDDGPDAEIVFFDHVVIFDHLMSRLLLVVNIVSSREESSESLIAEAAAMLDDYENLLARAAPDLVRFDSTVDSKFESNFTREEFESAVERAKEEIRAGEAFQIVLSQRWTVPFPTSEALMFYRALRALNPSPYMFLLRTDDLTVVGSSPELLVSVTGDRLETHPIAGTRPRGRNAEEDRRLAEELLADPKENAEHLMLVDLGRNDIGRVSRPGTVRVERFREIERYSHVMHMVSSVTGRLREDLSPIDALLAAFPAGTVSGAPRIRAMEIIDEIEPSRRGVYAGAIAYFGFSGNLDSCIAIRTVVLSGDVASIQAGAGIVFDSVPATEWQETVNKAEAMRTALSLARGALEQDRALEAERK